MAQSSGNRKPPANSRAARENQLIDLAMDVAEEQLRSGRATSQVVSHFLKLGSVREEIELEKLRKENALLDSRKNEVDSRAKNGADLEELLDQFRRYKGSTPLGEEF